MFATGVVDQIRARKEQRVAFVSRLPLEVGEQQIEELVRSYGACEDVHMLPPNGITCALFVTMSTAEEAALLIRSLNGATVFGAQLVANYPKEREDKKRRKTVPEDDGDFHVLEISLAEQENHTDAFGSCSKP